MDKCEWLNDLPLLTAEDVGAYLYEKSLTIADIIRSRYSGVVTGFWLLSITGVDGEPCFLERTATKGNDPRLIDFHSKVNNIFSGTNIFVFNVDTFGNDDMSYETCRAIYNSAKNSNVIYIDEKRSIKMENREWVNNLPTISVAQEDIPYGYFVKAINVIKEKYSDAVLGLWLLADKGVEGEPCFVLRTTLKEEDIRDLELYRDINNCFEPIGSTIYDYSRFIIENENMMKTANIVYTKEA